MALDPFIATHVNAGEPLTAQAWNDIVDALLGVHDVLLASRSTVKVTITNPDINLASVRVVALRAGEAPIEAVRPVGAVAEHTLTGLPAGSYTLRAEAPGFAPSDTPVDIAGADIEVDIALASAGAVMPDLFGSELREAQKLLADRVIPLSRLFDFIGTDLPPSNPGTEFERSPVLVQSPAPGALLANGEAAQLVIAVSPPRESSVEMPLLSGMTLAEAERALAALGLRVGRVKNLS